MPIDLVLFLKRNMDMIAKTLTNKTDIVMFDELQKLDRK
jgi:hypothetical protein